MWWLSGGRSVDIAGGRALEVMMWWKRF